MLSHKGHEDLAKAVKEAVNIPVVSINVIKQPEIAEEILEEEDCDLFSIDVGHWQIRMGKQSDGRRYKEY